MDIKDYKHRFTISGNEIELTINCKNGFWTCDITKGETGTGSCSGGVYESLDQYIKERERQHRYSFVFFTDGYNNAKNANNLIK